MSPKRHKLPEEFLVREAREDDADDLNQFTCSTGQPFEDEVEEFVRDDCLHCAMSGEHHGYHLLLVHERDHLVACTSYHSEPLPIDGLDKPEMATLIHLLAISLSHQGRRLDDGSPFSDAVLQTAIFDGLEKGNSDIATAIVAQDNLRAMAVLERNGLTSQIAYGPSYVRLTGRFEV